MIGETLGDYLILERLGQGGMGTVYQAEDAQGQLVALKVMGLDRTAHPAARRRFAQEARTLSTLHEPSIVAARSELAEERGLLFFAMEYVDGPDLGRVLRDRGRLPGFEAVAIAGDVLQALSSAHSSGVLHRDVKPSNVFLTARGRAKLGDFGLARMAGTSRVTQAGSLLGTPEYMAPEQAEGREASEQTDLYAVGVLLYEMLTGRPPFQAPTPLAVLRLVSEQAPPELGSTLPAALRAVVRRALQKDPAQRYRTADSMRQDLTAAIATHSNDAGVNATLALAQAPTVELRPPAPVPPAPGWWVGLTAAVALVALGVGAFLWASPQTPADAARTSEIEERLNERGAHSGTHSTATVAPVNSPPQDSWVEVTLRNGTTYSAWLLAVDFRQGHLLTTGPEGKRRRESLTNVRQYRRLAGPKAQGTAVSVTLRSGAAFEAELVEVDLEASTLVTRLPTGKVRRDPLDTVADYRLLSPPR